jgi:diacylglycerol O-acyltransferase
MYPVLLDDGTMGSAIINRFHHAIADGVRLTQLMLSMCDTEQAEVAARVARSAPQRNAAPDDEEDEPSVIDVAWSAAEEVTSAAVHGVGSLASGFAHALRHPVSTVVNAPSAAVSAVGAGLHGVEEGISLVRHPDRLLDAIEELGVENNRGTNDLSSLAKIALGQTESTVWTGEPGDVKSLAWSEQLPLAQIKAIGRARGATVNDVLLAAVAGGLRRYLDEAGEQLDEVLWMVPVNLKPFEDNLPSDLGNYFALVFMPMPLHHDDRFERLDAIHHRMERIKNSDEAVLTFGLQRVVSTSPSQVAYRLTNFFANKAVGVLTNVPGPVAELTFAGVPVTQVVGFAPCSGNQPMTTTIFSYNGGVTVGFATDAGLVPDSTKLVRYVVEELAAMGVDAPTETESPQ